MTFDEKIKNSPLCSIIMSVYNGELYVKETIKSVINQSYKNWELIIVDNCSTDKTIDILNNFQSINDNIKVYVTEFNSGGPAIPRNIGIKKTKGKYLAFLDSDDIWYENKLTIQLDYIKKYNLVCSLSNKIDEKGLMIYEQSTVSDQLIDLSALVMRNKIVHSSVVVHKNLFLSIMFDEDKLLNGLEDINAYRRYLALQSNGVLIGRPLISNRVLSSSLGSEIKGEKRLAKGIYSLVKSMIVTDRYDGILICLLSHIRTYIKYLIIKKLKYRKI